MDFQKASRVAKAKISAVKINMAQKSHNIFYYTMLMGMSTAVERDLGTIATDGKTIIVDPYFIVGATQEMIDNKEAHVEKFRGLMPDEALDKILKNYETWYAPKSNPEIEFFLKHEVRHLIGDTFGRGKLIKKKFGETEATHDLLNAASDHQINNILEWEYKQNEKRSLSGIVPIWDQLYHGDKYHSVEDGKYKQWTMEQIFVDIFKNGKGSGSSFDVHRGVSKDTAERTEAAIIAAGKKAGGHCPADVKIIIDELSEPKIDWKRALKRNIQSLIKHDYTYQVPCPSSWADSDFLHQTGQMSPDMMLINPSVAVDDTIHAVIVFDTSGSIFCDKETVKSIFSEIAGIVKTFTHATIDILCFDTRVMNYKRFTSATADDIKSYTAEGGGGTDIRCVPPFLKENDIPTENVTVFTDLYTPIDWEAFRGYKNLRWIIYDNDNPDVEVGQFIKFHDDNRV